MRIAILADTHGNLLALEAVLADLRAQAPDLIINLGDLFTGPFDPAAAPMRRSHWDAQLSPATMNATSWKATTPAAQLPSRAPFCRRRTWNGSGVFLQRYAFRMARCLPVMAAQPAATSTICLKT